MTSILQALQESSYKLLTKLYTGKIQNRDPAICEIKPVRAFDTETRDGNIFLVASQDNLGSRQLFNPTPDTLLRFLYNKRNSTSWNFFWNITYDAEVILKLILGEELSSYMDFVNYKHADNHLSEIWNDQSIYVKIDYWFDF